MRNPKLILHACHLSFDGCTDKEIEKKLGITPQSISNWRKTELWQEFQAELIAAEKQALIRQLSNRAEVEYPAQG